MDAAQIQEIEDSTDAAISEFNAIDFSAILRHTNPNKTSDLLETAVCNAIDIPRALYCPFCANEFMFEFPLRDHILKRHREELTKFGPKQINKMHTCLYCRSRFYDCALIPKHIEMHHGSEILRQWQEMSKRNVDDYEANKENELATCSPGLSELFTGLNTNSNRKRKMDDELDFGGTPNSTPQSLPRSILKKTPKLGPTITSPSSLSIRRFKNSLQHAQSARRELRFDLPPASDDSGSSTSSSELASIALSPKRTRMRQLKIFCLKQSHKKSPASPIIVQHSPSKLLTSTPINFLDDLKENYNPFDDTNKKNWKASIRRQKPSFYANEKFQCANCKKTYDNNADLLTHIKSNHRGMRRFFRPSYGCSLCGATFFRNSFLVRHCHYQHKPIY